MGEILQGQNNQMEQEKFQSHHSYFCIHLIFSLKCIGIVLQKECQCLPCFYTYKLFQTYKLSLYEIQQVSTFYFI